jgi:hypothetical protein
MIAEAFVYVIAVTLLIGLAALSLERFFAELDRPRRLAWLGAYAIAVVFPLASLLLAGAPATEAALATPVATVVAPAAIDWDALLLLLWGAATALLLLAYLASWIRLALLARRWPRVATERAPVVLADNVGPAVLGVFSPRIVLPRWLATAPEAVRSTVVAHELEHIAARDQVCIVATQLITLLLPWNLPLWWFARRLRAAIEVDCDARVLRRGVDAEHYADVLLEVGQRRPSSPYLAAALIEPVTQLEKRIRIMLTRRKPGAGLRAAAAAALALAIAACVASVEPPPVITGSDPAESAVGERKPTGWRLHICVPFVVGCSVRRPDAAVEPSAGAGAQSPASSALRIVAGSGSPGPFRVTKNEDGWLTAEGPELILQGTDDARMQVTTDSIIQATDGIIQAPDRLVLEGNVRLDFPGFSATAKRAVATKTDDGRTTFTLEDAVVKRQIENTGVEDAR